MKKEEYAVILEYLPNGYPLEKKMMPVAQAIGTINLALLELVPRKDVSLAIGEKVYIGEGKREKRAIKRSNKKSRQGKRLHRFF